MRHEFRIRLEREGRSTIDEIVASAREVPWALNVLQLLWTAGPVVYLALQGSHYLGLAPLRRCAISSFLRRTPSYWALSVCWPGLLRGRCVTASNGRPGATLPERWTCCLI
ncbi:MAG TPA: hypothetical protein VFY81_09065 [Gammaproteobacteria bacterium]|nr:hypothetical protein [Gammaproteobacteria bacterium]